MLFADRDPQNTVGMVLLDPSVPDQAALIAHVTPQFASPDPASDPLVAMLQQCASDMSGSNYRPGDPSPCLAYPVSFPPAYATMLAEHSANNTLLFSSAADIFASFEENSALIVNPACDYGDMQLVVLTALDRALPPGTPADMREQAATFDVEFFKQHEALARLSSRGIDVRIPFATHNIHVTAPQVVLDTVETLVRRWRREAAQADALHDH